MQPTDRLENIRTMHSRHPPRHRQAVKLLDDERVMLEKLGVAVAVGEVGWI
jgi:hypothetical protein